MARLSREAGQLGEFGDEASNVPKPEPEPVEDDEPELFDPEDDEPE